MGRNGTVTFARKPLTALRGNRIFRILLLVGVLALLALFLFAFTYKQIPGDRMGFSTGSHGGLPTGDHSESASGSLTGGTERHGTRDTQNLFVELNGNVRTKSVVNLRAFPGVDAPSLRRLPRGTWLRVMEKAPVPDEVDGLKAFWYQVALSPAFSGWVFGAFLESAPPGPWGSPDATTGHMSPFLGREGLVDTETLPRLFEAAGYSPDPSFKAYVVAIEYEPNNDIVLRRFDYQGTSVDRENWWPASSVKLFAAVAALEALNAMGFSSRSEVTFHYEKGDVTHSVQWLVEQAITPSNNTAFDRLVEIVGFEAMNRWFQLRGIADTVFLRGYSGRVKDAETNLGTLRESPAVTIREGSRRKSIPARVGSDKGWECPNQGNCTTLQDLTEVLRRVMMHESLPPEERFKIVDSEIQLLRKALSGKRSRGLGVVNGLRSGFGPHPIECFNKPGYAYQWFSDHVFVRCPDCPGPVKEWLVAMAGLGGRDVLDEGARIVGRLLATGSLLKGSPVSLEGSAEDDASEKRSVKCEGVKCSN